MIDFNTYKLLHLLGVITLFIAFGGAIGAREKTKWVSPVHGIALLVILVAGFGMLAQLGIHGSMPGWVIGKLVIWLLLGGALVLAKRKVLPGAVLIPVLIALGGVAASLALWKP